MTISPRTLAIIYAEVFKAHLEKHPSDIWGAKRTATDAMKDFAEYYKNNKHLWSTT